MTRYMSALAITLAVILAPLVQVGHTVRASNGTRTVLTVALRRQSCTATNAGAAVGAARFSPDDQGGNPGGLEIDVSLTAGLPRASYSVSVLGDPCQLLFSGGTLATDDSGRGDLSVHVPSTAVPPGASLRVQVAAPAAAEVITSDPVGAM
jgi:hypothetical protein